MGWMGNIVGDYLKFRGITLLGIIVYPILAPAILITALIFHIAHKVSEVKPS